MHTKQKESDNIQPHSKRYRLIADELAAMPAWKQEIYNNLFATSAHARKIKIAGEKINEST